MGAYYCATLKYPGKNWIRYESWSLKVGAKLMEHSYVLDRYVNFITYKIYYKPAHLVWLCDYHEKESLDDITWDDVPVAKIKNQNNKLLSIQQKFLCAIYVNLNKKEYFSLRKILQIAGRNLVENNPPRYVEFFISKETFHTYIIHPLPLLTNSEKEYAGGGDYRDNYKLRSYWAKDLIVAFPDSAEPTIKKYNFKDISEKVIVPIEEACRYNILREKLALYLIKFLKDLGTTKNPELTFIREYSKPGTEKPYLVFPQVKPKKVTEILNCFL